MVGIRGELAQQGVMGGGEHLLAGVRYQDELDRRVAEAIESGADSDGAREQVEEEMVMERLCEAFGAQVVRIDPDELGSPS